MFSHKKNQNIKCSGLLGNYQEQSLYFYYSNYSNNSIGINKNI